MAKVVWKTTPKAAYEWVELEGGDTMKDYERKSMLDDFIAENGLVPVESTFVGDVPTHKYGRYKANASAQALPVSGLPKAEDDAEKAALQKQVATLMAQLDKHQKSSKGAEVIGEDDPEAFKNARLPDSTGGGQTTEDAREAINSDKDEDEKIASGTEVREHPTNDKSANNPPVRGRPRKDA